MKEFNIATGKRIRELREQNGYTRERLGELAGINDKFLYEVEVGKKGLSAQKMFRLSRSLNVSMDYLVTGDQKGEEYMIATSLLSTFEESEIKIIEDIIRKIILLSKYRQPEE